jgi:hypothetical protein
MIRNVFRRKARKDKQGSMLTLVLVILVMALIFIASSIMVTNSTRSRYLDNVLSGQARIAATSYAEAFCSSLQTQEITDEQLKGWCKSGQSATVSSASIPGMGGSGDNEVTVSFSYDASVAYYYVDVSSTLGSKANGDVVTENVRVMLKERDPEAKTNLFNHLIEVGDNASFSEFDGVGHGAPAGIDNNTVMCHGPSDLTKNGNADFDANIILKDRTHLGNGGQMTGYVLFAGPNAGFSDVGSGNPVFGNFYFMSPSASTPGKAFQTDGKILDMTYTGATFANFTLNGQMRGGSNPTYYEYTNMTIGNTGSDSAYKTYVQNQVADNAGNAALQSAAADMMTKATDAMNSHFPTTTEASANFLKNVPEDILANDHGALTGAKSGPLEPGVYHLSGTISNMYEIDASHGGYVFYIDGNTTIYSSSGAGFTIKNGDNNSDAYWPRFIIKSGCYLRIGSASVTNMNGIISTTHVNDSAPSKVLSNSTQKPHCYVYGIDATLWLDQEHNVLDCYGGVYGSGSKVIIKGSNYFFGRLAAMNMESDNANNTEIPYCPGPMDNIHSSEMVAMSSNFDIVRFKYYY